MTDVAKSQLPHESAKPRPRQPRWKPVLLTIAGVAVLAWIIHFSVHAYYYEETDDAYVTGHLYQISPQIAGQVLSVAVNDNQTVKAGDVLVRLDPLQFTLAVQKARDQLAQAQAQETESRASLTFAASMINQSEAKAKQAEAQVGQTEAELALAKLTLKRSEQLFAAGGVIAASDLDNARSAFRTAEASHAANQAGLAAAQATVASSKAGLDSLNARVAAAVANVAVSRSALADAKRVLTYATLTAPADGRVGNKYVEAGNHVAAGQTLMSLASLDAWIMANFKETQLTRMHPGQAVNITLDTLPGLKLHGTVDSLSPASGSQFALLPPDNATGNFNKVVQRVPVKIILDADSLKAVGPRLRLGLSVVVDVRVR
ncbi:MAG TPA: HlyD family secretion protein [Rariglobus sp.]|jgi:membrane fusion protein (multidrug efflux system)|nr:HlyD family secretion protein [Rariglobus sp.]